MKRKQSEINQWLSDLKVLNIMYNSIYTQYIGTSGLMDSEQASILDQKLSDLMKDITFFITQTCMKFKDYTGTIPVVNEQENKAGE